MEQFLILLRSKPRLFPVVTAVYIAGILVFKWLHNPSADAVWFIFGGAIGVYFLEAAEQFFALSPSPFRSVVFAGLFSVVSLFVVTSSGSALGSGLVLSLFLQLVMRQIGEYATLGHLDSWYRMITVAVPRTTQRSLLMLFAAVFVLETYAFIR